MSAQDTAVDDTESHTTDEQPQTLLDRSVTRRNALRGGAALGTIAMIGSVPAFAQTSTGVDYSSGLVHEGRLEATAEIAEVDLSSQSRYGYVDDSGSETSLADDGFSERTREDADEDVDGPIAHNPDSYHPGLLSADELTAFPRGVTYDHDSDTSTDEEGVSALDSTHWSITTNTSATAAVSDVDDSLNISGGDGDVLTFAQSDFLIDSGEARKVLQLIVDATDLTGSVSIEAVNSGSETPVANLDTAADSSLDSTIATSTGDGIVYQMQLGDLTANADITDIDALKVSISGGSADITIHGLNLDSESKWSLGEREIVNSDDEIETETIEQSQSGGYLDVTSISTLGDRLSSATIEAVRHDVEQWSRDLPADRQLAFVDDSPSGYDTSKRLTQAMRHWMPTAYDLDWSSSELILVGGLQESRYIDLGYQLGAPVVETQEEILNDLATTYVGDQVTVGADSELSIATSMTPGDDLDIVADIVLSESEVDTVKSSAFTGGAVAAGSGGGLAGYGRYIFGTIIAAAVVFRQKLLSLISG